MQVVILHHMLSKATMKQRPSVLWCFKKELGFSTYLFKHLFNSYVYLMLEKFFAFDLTGFILSNVAIAKSE